jgi:hypothetical protein
MIRLAETVSAIRAAASASASAVVASGWVSVKWSRAAKPGSLSTDIAIAFIIVTASTGHWPLADSAESITASAPS